MSENDRKVTPIRPSIITHAETMVFLERQGLNTGDGGGTSGGMTDDWKASVDSQLAQLHGDVRNLLYGLIGGFLFLIAGAATIYVKLSDQSTAIQLEQAKASVKLDAVDKRLESIDQKLDVVVGKSPKN